MNISDINTNGWEESSMGELHQRKRLIGLRVESRNKSVELTYDSNDKLRHKKYGYLLEVDAAYGSPCVEIAEESQDEYGWNQWMFDDLDALKVWLKQNTEIPD